MRRWLWIGLFPLMIGCDVVKPTLLTGSVDEIPPEAFVNAAVSVLHQEGYTVLMADRLGGIVTTDWRDESSFASQAFLDISRRTRMSVVMDFLTHELQVQMTKQKKEGDLPWRNDGLSETDRQQMRLILERIRSKARAIHNQQGQTLAGSG